MPLVYKIVFPNNKVYIGKTKNISDRIKKHKYSIRYYDTKLTKAFVKYGFENLKWEILFESQDIDEVNNKEKEYISLHNSICNGYNISKGGDGGDTISKNPNKDRIIISQLRSKGVENYIVIDSKLSKSIINDYESGKYGIRGLSKKYKISRQRLTRFLKSNEILIDKNRSSKITTFTPSKELIDRILVQFKNGSTINQISKKENLTILLVSRVLHDIGIRKSKRFINGRRYDGKQPKIKG